MARRVFVKHCHNAGEVHLYKHITSFAARYNGTFRTLTLPEALGIDEGSNTLTLPFYEGETFHARWTEADGGAPLHLDLVVEMAALLADLLTINWSTLTSDAKLMRLPKVRFDRIEAAGHAMLIAERLHKANLLVRQEVDAIRDALSIVQTSPLTLNNGDFYPRNLIRQSDGRVVVIDWETWNENSPFYVLDHPENVAAVAMVHMWGNPKWQTAYASELSKYIALDQRVVTKALVMKALELANMSLNDPPFLGAQLSLLRGALA